MNIEANFANKAMELINYYYPFYFMKYPRSKDQVINKYKKFFLKAAEMFSIRDEYDSEKLILSFVADGLQMPFKLPYETTWKRYKEYLVGLGNRTDIKYHNLPGKGSAKEYAEYWSDLNRKISDTEQIVRDIVNAASELKKFGTVQNWLDKKINQFALETNNLKFDLTLFSFSFSFEFYCLDNGLNIDISKLRKRVADMPNKNLRNKIIKKMKDILKDDFLNYSERNLLGINF